MSVSPIRIVASLLIWIILMLSLSAYYLWHWMRSDHLIPDEYRILVVESGESVSSVAMKLHNRGILRWPNVWRAYARFIDDKTIKAGEYQLGVKESPIRILNLLQSGNVKTYWLTLIEGKNYFESLANLHAQDRLQKKLYEIDLEEQLLLLALPIQYPEGWFYPDTYQYHSGESDVDILRRAYKKMAAILEEEWQARAKNLPYKNAYEALIMASIVEKETGVAQERSKIAGVFVRRLEKGMRLQTDPTVIYGMGESYQGNIRRSDLKTDTPYNTYTRSGLPPTPIAMPGREAIHAALHPLPGDELYFVAKGDGSHHFSATLQEHNQAVSKYQKFKRVDNYRSSPQPKLELENEQTN